MITRIISYIISAYLALQSCILFADSIREIKPLEKQAITQIKSTLKLIKHTSHPWLNNKQIILKFQDFLPVNYLSKRQQKTLVINTGINTTLQRLNILSLHFKRQTGRDKISMVSSGTTQQEAVNQLKKTLKILSSTSIKNWGPLFSRPPKILQSERASTEKLSGQELPALDNYYFINLKSAATSTAIIGKLLKLDIIETAYYSPIPEPAVDIAPPTTDFTSNQGYLDPASSGGIDARYGWTIPGGKGNGVKIIDIEGGWELQHEDLPEPFFQSGFTFNEGDLLDSSPFSEEILKGRNHGTAVLGELIAINNDYGISGIAYEASFGVASVFRPTSPQLNPGVFLQYVADTINDAASHLQAGDIILIEQHAPGPGDRSTCEPECGQTFFIAMEYWQAEFDAIRLATAKGLLVVAAAGNGSQSLDDPQYDNRFNRNTRNSGAIIVGAGTSDSHAPLDFSNYGTRVDLQGWGRNVMTLGYGDEESQRIDGDDQRQWYTSTFSGTSSAAPIVAGAAAVIQGVSIAQNGIPLGPKSVRDLLVSTGTPQDLPALGNIGPLPNLRAALDQLVIAPPEEYGVCNAATFNSNECGGGACVNKVAGHVEGDCFFFGLFCDDGYYAYHTDQFVCANSSSQ